MKVIEAQLDSKSDAFSIMNSNKKTSFLLIGEMVVDLISADLVSSLQEVDVFNRFAGGTVANLCGNLHRLGYPASLAASVGEDGFGQFLKCCLAEVGIAPDLIQTTSQAPTTLIPIARSTGTPDFIIYRGADQYISPTQDLLEAASQAHFVHTSAFALSREPARSTILAILKSAHADHKTISLDPNYHPAHGHDCPDFLSALKEVYQYVTITKPSLDDSQRIFGAGNDPVQYLDHFLDLGPDFVVLTLGDQGALLGLASGERYHLRPNPVDVIDVTGAGDAFWSGMLAGLYEGLPPLNAAKLGQTVAEYKIGVLGPILEHPPLEDYIQRSEQVLIDFL